MDEHRHDRASRKVERQRGVRAVFFDLAGTLIEVKDGLGHRYATVARDFGVEADATALNAAFPPAFEAAGRMVFARPHAAEVASLEKGFWREVVRGVFARTGLLDRFQAAAFDSYFNCLFDHFATADAWNVFDDVVPTLERLRTDARAVGLITNFDRRVFPLVEALDLARLIDSISIPSIAGAAKPETGIFEHALQLHGLRATEAVQVGDSVRDDVEGARAAGLHAVLLDRKGRHSGSGLLRVTTLAELPALLGME